MPTIRLSRRGVLAGSAALGAGLFAPAISRAQSRPVITHGVQSGDIAHDGAVVWARADREANMLVEWATTEGFADPRRVPVLAVGEPTGLAGKIALEGLPADILRQILDTAESFVGVTQREVKKVPLLRGKADWRGAALLIFRPGGMSFDEYFRLEGCDFFEQQARFIAGLSPAMPQMNL